MGVAGARELVRSRWKLYCGCHDHHEAPNLRSDFLLGSHLHLKLPQLFCRRSLMSCQYMKVGEGVTYHGIFMQQPGAVALEARVELPGQNQSGCFQPTILVHRWPIGMPRPVKIRMIRRRRDHLCGTRMIQSKRRRSVANFYNDCF